VQQTSPLVFYVRLQMKQYHHLLHIEEMKHERTVETPNSSSAMGLHALPEAWREEARRGEVAWPEVEPVVETEM